nr:MAG TPA: L SHAPED TAIL FIBER PROTEIN [Caudoviricetes sp.]
MALHEVQLKGYSVRPGNLSFGTFGSYGIEQLHVTLDDTWSGLAVTATFNQPEGEPVERRVPENGLIDVPAEATANAGTGTIVYCGVANGVQRITKTQGYNVYTRGNVGTTVPFNPSESLATQVLQAALNAEKNSAEAKIAAANAVIAAANSAAAAKSSENAAANSATAAKVSENAAATSEDNARISAGAAAVSEGKAAASADKAKANKTAAAESEQAAAASAVAAAGSAAQAEAQKTAAAKSASDAQGYMQTASGAATAANASAENAAGSKAAAGNSASAAAGSEQAAGASEVKAAESERAAKASEQAAAKSAQAALESKTAAATSEVNAAASAMKAQDVSDSLPADYTTAVNDIGTLKNQMQRAYPDDSAIGENPWSSKNIVDMLCPPLEESGNPVVCYPVAGYPLGVKASWEPVQEGSGTPSPENIRPIEGRDSVTVERCGENILNPKAYTSTTTNGITFTVNEDKSVRVIGTATGRAVFKLYSYSYKMSLPDGTYTFSTIANVPSGACILIGCCYKNSNVYKKNLITLVSGRSTTTVSLHGIEMLDGYIDVAAGNTIDTTLYPMLVLGTTAPTTYTPYNGQTNTLTLPETVYGGEVDAVTGEGQETWRLLNNPSSYNYYEGTAEGGWVQSEDAVAWFLYNPAFFSKKTKVLSNIFNVVSDIARTVNPYTIGGKNNYIAFRLPRSVAATGKDVKNWLASNGVEIAFEAITQTPFTATGAQPIHALAKANTVLTDADSAIVTGRADPIKKITDLEDAVASQT